VPPETLSLTKIISGTAGQSVRHLRSVDTCSCLPSITDFHRWRHILRLKCIPIVFCSINYQASVLDFIHSVLLPGLDLLWPPNHFNWSCNRSLDHYILSLFSFFTVLVIQGQYLEFPAQDPFTEVFVHPFGARSFRVVNNCIVSYLSITLTLPISNTLHSRVYNLPRTALPVVPAQA
jgi:hypothetical protein